MQGLKRDEGSPEGHHEEWSACHERQVSGLRNRALPDPQAIAPHNSRQVAIAIASAAQQAKAEDVVILDLRKLSYSFDFFVICTGSSDRRVRTITDDVEEALDPLGVRRHHQEGNGQGGWVLLDYGPVVGHIFDPELRDYYRLERLWADAPRVRFRHKK